MRVAIVEGVVEIADADAADLLIIFAHRDAPGFAFETASQGLGCARLFIRDPSLRGWYNGGLPGVGETIPEIADFIRQAVDLDRYRRIATLGSSMGGYAALLFGAMLGADKALAFNPQTVLSRLFPLSPPEGIAIQRADLREVLESAQNTQFEILIGDDDAVDLCHASHLVGLAGVRVSRVPGASHLLTEELNRRGELSRLLQRWFDGDELDVIEAVPAAASQDAAESLERAVLAFLRDEHEVALPLLTIAWQHQPDHPGLSLFVGLSAFKTGNLAAAIPAFRRTLRYRPGWDHARRHLRKCLHPEEPMTEPASNEPDAEITFDGVGQSVDAAVLDAIQVANGRRPTATDIEARVVDWGVRVTGIGGARLFWARVRVIS